MKAKKIEVTIERFGFGKGHSYWCVLNGSEVLFRFKASETNYESVERWVNERSDLKLVIPQN